MKAKHFKRVFSLLAASAVAFTTVASAASPIHVKSNEMLRLAKTSETMDSTMINIPSQQQLRPNIHYIESKSTIIPTDTAGLSALTECPKNGPTDCPDLNGGGTNANTPINCPDVCLARKKEIYGKYVVVDNQVVFTKPGSQEQAFCPPTYASVGVTEMAPDQVYITPGPTITNFTSIDSIDKMKNFGYSCGGDGVTMSTPTPSYNSYCPGNFLKLDESTMGALLQEQQAAVQAMKDKYDQDVVQYNSDKAAYTTAWNEYMNLMKEAGKENIAIPYGTRPTYEEQQNSPVQPVPIPPTEPPVPDYNSAGSAGSGSAFSNPRYMLDATQFNTPYVVLLTDYKMVIKSCTIFGNNYCQQCAGWDVQLNFQAFYQKAACVGTAGYYPADTKSPHATICTRVRSEWKGLRDN